MLTVIHFGTVTVFKPVHRSWIRNIFCSDGEQFILEFSIRAKEGRVYIFFSSILAFLTPILDELFHFGVTVCEKVSISDSQNCCKLHVNLSSWNRRRGYHDRSPGWDDEIARKLTCLSSVAGVAKLDRTWPVRLSTLLIIHRNRPRTAALSGEKG